MLPKIDIDVREGGILQDLSSINDDLANVIYNESQSIGSTFTREITDYPPETEGNQPPTPYYSRGIGYVRGGGTVDPLSEDFKTGVTHRVTRTANEIIIHFRLNPSYSNWLVGSAQQARFHALHGWKTIRTVLKGLNIDADENSDTTIPMTNNMRQAVAAIMERLSKYK